MGGQSKKVGPHLNWSELRRLLTRLRNQKGTYDDQMARHLVLLAHNDKIWTFIPFRVTFLEQVQNMPATVHKIRNFLSFFQKFRFKKNSTFLIFCKTTLK